MSLTVGVFFHEKAGAPWAMLPATSNRITKLASLPNIGNRLVVQSADHELILAQPLTDKAVGNLPEDFYKTVVTVTERIYDYSLCDVALICEYRSF